MPEQVSPEIMPDDYTQLSQAHVPIEQAEDAFTTKDASGRTPIVVMTSRALRVQSIFVILAIAVLGAGILGGPLFKVDGILAIAIVAAVILIIVGIYRSLYVRIPEGANALLAKGGKYVRTIGSGPQVIPPWLVVSHVVTRREIPFDVPVAEAPTADNVRATVDALVTFTIVDPYKFVYSISASDFDRVFQAACQFALRSMIRGISSDQVNDLVKQPTEDLKDHLSRNVEQYGVNIQRLTITYSRPPEDFMRSQEARQLAVFQREQQIEEQMLAQRRQAHQEALERQRAIAQVERQREELQAQIQQAEMRKQVTELEMQAQAMRLSSLEDLLQRYPHAAEWEWQGAQLEVARALAGNTRAVLQVGSASDIVSALMVREVIAQGSANSAQDNHETHISTPATSAS